MVNKKIVTWIFILIFPLLFAQLLFVVLVEEPYPAIVYPLFGGVDGHNDVYQNVQQEILAISPNDTIKYSKGDLFFDVPESFRYYLMKLNLKPGVEKEKFQDPEFVLWMYNRLIKLGSRVDIYKMEVHWYNYFYDIKTDPTTVTRESAGTVVVNFNSL